jgi:hypothetical protein
MKHLNERTCSNCHSTLSTSARSNDFSPAGVLTSCRFSNCVKYHVPPSGKQSMVPCRGISFRKPLAGVWGAGEAVPPPRASTKKAPPLASLSLRRRYASSATLRISRSSSRTPNACPPNRGKAIRPSNYISFSFTKQSRRSRMRIWHTATLGFSE